ncbi:MAG: ABC transporter permease, partial [Burkholderiaceae bacterium]
MDSTAKKLWANASVRFGVLVLGFMLLMGLAAPWLGTVDPASMDYNQVNTAAGTSDVFINADGDEIEHTFWFGTDHFGRDIYSRVVYGARVSLMVAVSAAVLALLFGSVIGMLSGYFRAFDMALMRVMDGLMAIPAILLAIALVAALGANVATVVVAIAVPEIPRVSRLVRSLVLTLREEPFVEAARALATPTPVILWRHILPNAMAPLIVQGTFVAASAVLLEAILSFLGLGLPPDIPTWGNIMAEGRVLFRIYPHNIMFPGIFLAITVLAVNMLGDGFAGILARARTGD